MKNLLLVPPTIAAIPFAIVVSFLLLNLTIVQSVQAQSDVAWKWKAGDQFDVNLQQESSVVTSVDGRVRQVDNLTILEFSWEVTDVNGDGNATIKQSIKRVRIKTGAPGVVSDTTLDFDTDQPDVRLRGLSKSLREQALPLVGVEFTGVVSSRGEIRDVSFSDETLELLRALPASTQIRKIFSTEGLQSLYGTAMLQLPEELPEEGGTWKVEKTVQHPATQFVRSSEFTFVGVEGSKANFAVETLVTESGSTEGVIQLKSFSGAGEYSMDQQAGHLRESEVRSELETEAAYQDKKMQTKVTTTTAMKVNKK